MRTVGYLLDNSSAMLIELLTEEAKGGKAKILVTTALAGLANAGVLALVNMAARSTGEQSPRMFVLLFLVCALYALSYRYCLARMSSVFEEALYHIRTRVADKVRRTELEGLEAIGTTEIYGRLTQETSVISHSAWAIAGGLEAAVMLTFMSLYMLYLSPAAFALTLLVFGSMVLIYQAGKKQANELMERAGRRQLELFERLTDLLTGFKELRLRARRSEDLYQDFTTGAAGLAADTLQTNLLNQTNYVFANLSLFALLAATVFLLPRLVPEYTGQLPNLVSAILFMFSAVGGMVSALPQYRRADLAATQIYALEQKLTRAAARSYEDGPGHDPWNGRFHELCAVDLEYHYPEAQGRESFAVGPIGLTVRAGEIVFLVGGNGSGKTTLLKVLTGLYAPAAGSLLVNGVPLQPSNVQAYREMIAAIFGDFHLFKKLYGLSEDALKDLPALLSQMRIADKVSCVGRSLSTLQLSTGQRKRLAMAIALVEDRPIYVFDEWAADQDPEFRKYYYEELLPELRRRGKAIIAISHDDRYFQWADRIVTMEYGRIRSSEPGGLSQTGEANLTAVAATEKSDGDRSGIVPQN